MGTPQTDQTLDPLLRPQSVAIVGASDDPTRTGGRPLRYLLESRFAGKIFPINPNRKTVQGLPAYASLCDAPEAPDVALIAVPADAAGAAMRDCAAAGVRATILFTAGLAEIGEAGRAVQAEIMAIARGAGIRVLGPNCLGLHSAHDGFIGTFASILDRGLPQDGPIGIVSQSGAFGMYIAYLAQCRGLGVAHAVTTGNEPDIDVSEVLHWLARQPHVRIILAYAESIRDGTRFIAALRAAHDAGKPVIFTKVGASQAGARAAASHTDALAGEDAVFDAILRQFGAFRATTTEELIDIAYAASRGIFPRSARLGIVTGSGGVGVQLCDAATRFGLDVPPLPAPAQDRIRSLLPFAAATNPVDVTAQALSDMSVLARSLRIVLEEGDYDAVIAAFLGLPLARPFAGSLRDALVEGTRGFGDKVIVLNANADPDVVRDYEREGFLVFEDATRSAQAVAALVHLGCALERQLPPEKRDVPATEWREPHDEAAAKSLLAAAGVPVPREHLVRSAAEAVSVAAAIGGPVAMKIISPDIAHKTEIGGVLLSIEGDVAVRAAYDTLIERGVARAPRDRIAGVLVSPMAGAGVETILGAVHDPVFGPVIMFGLGGVFAELFGEVSFRRAPLDRAEAKRMIDETRGRALLDGVRGAPPADIDALIDALVALSDFAAAHAERFQSIDINPFLVRRAGEGAVALDALIVPRRISEG